MNNLNFKNLKTLFLRALIFSLIAAALLAVITVIIGKFNSLFDKALITILMVAIHSLISLGFITNNEKTKTFDNLAFFTNTAFVIIIASFLTSVMWTWNIVHPTLGYELYELYFVILFASLHGEALFKITGKQNLINKLVYSNYIFMSGVVIMLIPIIFFQQTNFPSIYFRLLAAIGIIDATLTIISVIQYKLYLQKNPDLNDNLFGNQSSALASGQPSQVQYKKHHMNIFLKIFIILMALQFIAGLVISFITTRYL